MKALLSSAYHSLGRKLFKIRKPFIRMARQFRYPDIPAEYKLTKVDHEGRTLAIQSRRWNDGDDASAIEQCFEQKQYDFPVGAHGALLQRIYEDILASGRKPLIVDCGANIGASVLWYFARYPRAHIVAIEPSPANFVVLQANCKNLDVDLRLAGIAAEDGRATLLQEESAMACRTVPADSNGPVEMISLQTVVNSKPSSEYVPFLVKIDIEGGEATLFDGDNAAFNSFPLIVMEPHDWLLPGKLSSRGFFRFHAASGREFCLNSENVASVVKDDRLLEITTGLTNGML